MPDNGGIATTAIRTATRRIKTHIANRYLKLADRVDEKGIGDLSEKEIETYEKLTSEFARNVVPRSQEISGEDGGALQVSMIKYAETIHTPQTGEETAKE